MLKGFNTGFKQIAGIKVAAYLVVLVMIACSVDKVSAAEIRIGGAADDCKGFFEVFKELFRDETGINLLVAPTSSVQSLIDLDMGNIDIATTDETLGKLISNLEN